MVINNHVADRQTGTRLAQTVADMWSGSTGLPYAILHYSELDRCHISKAIALVSCGFPDPYESFDVLKEQRVQLEILADAPLPVLGICGGHQLLAMAHGGSCAPMAGGESERGPVVVRRAGDDPMLAGLPESFLVWEDHWWEVVRLPPTFKLILAGDRCRVQGMRHVSRPLYGVQFHPELPSGEGDWGRRLLQNFFRLAVSETHRRGCHVHD